jgi:hypothetical protein
MVRYFALLIPALAALLLEGARSPVSIVASAAETPWQYYTPAPNRNDAWRDRAERPASSPQNRATGAPSRQESPRENPYGFPIGQDPLFRESGRADWQQQHLERPQYQRPTYDRPTADDAPIYRQEAWNRPNYQKPMYDRPFDDKPRYTIKNYQAPGYMKPTTTTPYDQAPNYEIHPYLKPAYDNRPAYVAPEDYRPEYTRPDYVPQEYHRPRDVPPPFIAPPE